MCDFLSCCVKLLRLLVNCVSWLSSFVLLFVVVLIGNYVLIGVVFLGIV